jgi:hypothetical protein
MWTLPDRSFLGLEIEAGSGMVRMGIWPCASFYLQSPRFQEEKGMIGDDFEKIGLDMLTQRMSFLLLFALLIADSVSTKDLVLAIFSPPS